MELEIKVAKKSITAQWFLSVFLVIAAVVTVLEVMLCLVIQSRYYNTTYELASGYCKGLSLLSPCSAESFPDVAKEYVEQFEHKDKIEIQIIDRGGNVLITSNGFEPVAENMPIIPRRSNRVNRSNGPAPTKAVKPLWPRRPF